MIQNFPWAGHASLPILLTSPALLQSLSLFQSLATFSKAFKTYSMQAPLLFFSVAPFHPADPKPLYTFLEGDE